MQVGWYDRKHARTGQAREVRAFLALVRCTSMREDSAESRDRLDQAVELAAGLLKLAALGVDREFGVAALPFSSAWNSRMNSATKSGCIRLCLRASRISPSRTARRMPLRFVHGVRIAISSMPITCGPGLPARASWACMYCWSGVLTVCQSSRKSAATSLIVADRQRWPT